MQSDYCLVRCEEQTGERQRGIESCCEIKRLLDMWGVPIYSSSSTSGDLKTVYSLAVAEQSHAYQLLHIWGNPFIKLYLSSSG
jgi:hypothetical protein